MDGFEPNSSIKMFEQKSEECNSFSIKLRFGNKFDFLVMKLFIPGSLPNNQKCFVLFCFFSLQSISCPLVAKINPKVYPGSSKSGNWSNVVRKSYCGENVRTAFLMSVVTAGLF